MSSSSVTRTRKAGYVFMLGSMCLTCQNHTHEPVPDERSVYDAPQPLEMSQDVVDHSWTGSEEVVDSRPELGCKQRDKYLRRITEEAVPLMGTP